MKLLLAKAGYHLDPTTGVWARPDYKSIAYSDGDEVEERIADIVTRASDLTVLSSELHRHCNDWPSLYHLNGSRANIVRPFQDMLAGKYVLEIGAGCGAITRYLGESQAKVFALEGSLRRARIVRSRTRNLLNVSVIADGFDRFECAQRFDFVFMIGVLEYAKLFTTSENPYVTMLSRARSFLKPTGKLIIAIENQFGLKYFAGAREDHLGLQMYGIEGRYSNDQPQTFGRIVLNRLLQTSGFQNVEYLLPFPDYKFPVSVLSGEGLTSEDFDSAVFAWQSTICDRQLAPYYHFSLEAAWSAVFDNQMALDLGNSFLVVASLQQGQKVEEEVLAYHFSTGRQPQYCKETIFKRSISGSIDITYRRLGGCENDREQDRLVRFVCPERDIYRSGFPLALNFVRTVTVDGWTMRQVSQFFKDYLSILQNIFREKGVYDDLLSPRLVLPGMFFDAVPQNIIVNRDGCSFLIDSEWEANFPVEMSYLFFRAIFVSLNSVVSFGRMAGDGPVLTYGQFCEQVFAEVGIQATVDDIEHCFDIEQNVQEQVSGPFTEHVVWRRWACLPLPSLFSRHASGDVNSLAVERDNLILERDNLWAERDAMAAERNALLNSYSWRCTAPIRLAVRLMRSYRKSQERQHLTQILYKQYARLPLPACIRSVVTFVHLRLFRKVAPLIRHIESGLKQFHAPSIKPAAPFQDRPDYFVWGVIDWHFRHQRPQQLALVLSENRRVFYISPAFVNDVRAGFEVEVLNKSGRLLQIKLFVKGSPIIYSDAPDRETVAQLRRSVGEVLGWSDSQQIVSLVDHPFWYDVASVLPNSRLVYDCMDHHAGFGNNGQSLLIIEKQLLSRADLTIVTSLWLDSKIAADSKRHVLIRNACDYEHFSAPPDRIYHDSLGRQVIGYYGAIAEWFDLELIEAVARQHTDCSVLLIGSDTINAKSKLAKLPNVTFKGEVPYSELPYYLHGFHVCLLPFRVTPLTLATNPVKVYEYLGAGKPVVTTRLPEMAQFGDLARVTADSNGFLAAVQECLSQAETEASRHQRKVFAMGQTWQHRAEELIQHAESAEYDPKVSVVVVTYNNLDFTRSCLESLDKHNQYANTEIIVIDNASSDDSPAFLSGWVLNGHQRKLILNEENRGFAAANNQGLDVATGDYLVLLNNDTYVTPGWVRTLVHHLKNDTKIGLIGPVTNNIGNEAKIDISHSDMDEMLAKSASYTRRHIGQVYPLRTAAFFCAMMPRATYEKVGRLDESFGQGFFEDDDYCRRIEAIGLRIVCAEDVFVHHHLSASFDSLKQQERQKLFDKNRTIYEAKWGAWTPHCHRSVYPSTVDSQLPSIPGALTQQRHLTGVCVICGNKGVFFYKSACDWRESLICQNCRSTSRYRSIAKGLLRAINELTGLEASSLAALPNNSKKKIHVYDTQTPFYYETCAYPLPDLMKATSWINVTLSQYKPKRKMGETLAKNITNQNLERLTFPDESFDILITSAVMEHVRLDDRAHGEIYRVLKPGGIYIFTVPHSFALDQTLIRVQIVDPNDPSKDIQLLEPEYHGDANNDETDGALTYRTYGRDIKAQLTETGFEVEYCREDIEHQGILSTELFYCKKVSLRRKG